MYENQAAYSSATNINKQIIFNNAILQVRQKGGVLKKDERGAYHIPLGALGSLNSAGEVYVDTPVARRTFMADSRIAKKAAEGNLWGEYGHPRMVDSPSPEAFKVRIREVVEKMISHNIVGIYLTPIEYEGKKYTGIIGRVKPHGPYGDALEKSLNDPECNVAMSGRYFSNLGSIGGRTSREIHTVVTWDFVNMPGVAPSSKFSSPSLESDGIWVPQDDIVYHEEDILMQVDQNNTYEMSLEDNGGLSMAELAKAFNIVRTSASRGFERGELLNW